MTRLPHRILGLVAVPALGVALAACGSTAINADYTPGPTPSTSPMAVGQPTKAAAKKTARPKMSARPTARVTHGTAPTKPAAPRSSAPASHPTRSTGGTHTVRPTSATITVTPWSGLSDGQTVTIRGSHFNPNTQVIIVECVNKGANTQQTNCTGNGGLLGIPSGFQPAADGTFTKTFVVHKSFSGIGGGSNTCSASSPCIISVTEANNNPTEEADAPIIFR